MQLNSKIQGYPFTQSSANTKFARLGYSSDTALCHGMFSAVQASRHLAGGGGNVSDIKATVLVYEFNSMSQKCQHASCSSDVELSAASII